jgi:chemotaxis protein MotB
MFKNFSAGTGKQIIIFSSRVNSNDRKLKLFISSVILTCFFLLTFIYGCGGEPRYYLRPNFEIKNVKRIAVLPFENFTSNEYAAEKIRRAVIIELLTRGIDVIEPGEVLKTLKDLKLTSIGSLSNANIQDIGKTLGIEAVLVGSVGAFGISKGISVSYPEVSLKLTLLETAKGNIIWSVSHTSGGAGFWTRHFGAEVATLDETERVAVKEALDTLSVLFKDIEAKYRVLEGVRLRVEKQEGTTMKTGSDERVLGLEELEAELKTKDMQVSDLEKEIERLLRERARDVEVEKEIAKERIAVEIKQTYEDRFAELMEEVKKGEIEITNVKDKFTITIVNSILFKSGSAGIRDDGREVLDRVAGILKDIKDKRIMVEGHTDTVPISPKLIAAYPTNWELSVARATNVARYLQEKGGIDPKILSATGYGEFRPVASNETEEGRARNRRIEIILLPFEEERKTLQLEGVKDDNNKGDKNK